jgi:hypothetical protein
MNNNTTSKKMHLASKSDLPQTGFIQPSYGRYGGYYGIITGVENRFFSTKSKAKDWFDDLGVTPVYC